MDRFNLKRIIFYTFLISGITAISQQSFAQSSDAKLKYSNNFNKGWGDVILAGYCAKAGEKYTFRKVASEGAPKHSHQFWLEKGYACTKVSKKSACLEGSGKMKTRSLIDLGKNYSDERGVTYINQHRWLGYRMYIHPDTTTLSGPTYGPVIYQSGHNGRTADHNTLYLTKKGVVHLKTAFDNVKYTVKTVKIGQWVDVVIHQYFTSKGQGVLEIWMDGKKVFEDEGPVEAIASSNSYRSQVGTYIGLGGADLPSGYEIATCYDDIKLAEGKDAYKLVSPSGSSAPTTTVSDSGSGSDPDDEDESVEDVLAGTPKVSNGTEKGLFLYKDSSGNYHLRSASDGDSIKFRGQIKSDKVLKVVKKEKMESSDFADLIGQSKIIDFKIDAKNKGFDEFVFSAPAKAKVTLDLDSGDAKLLKLGPKKIKATKLPYKIQ